MRALRAPVSRSTQRRWKSRARARASTTTNSSSRVVHETRRTERPAAADALPGASPTRIRRPHSVFASVDACLLEETFEIEPQSPRVEIGRCHLRTAHAKYFDQIAPLLLRNTAEE